MAGGMGSGRGSFVRWMDGSVYTPNLGSLEDNEGVL